MYEKFLSISSPRSLRCLTWFTDALLILITGGRFRSCGLLKVTDFVFPLESLRCSSSSSRQNRGKTFFAWFSISILLCPERIVLKSSANAKAICPSFVREFRILLAISSQRIGPRQEPWGQPFWRGWTELPAPQLIRTLRSERYEIIVPAMLLGQRSSQSWCCISCHSTLSNAPWMSNETNVV